MPSFDFGSPEVYKYSSTSGELSIFSISVEANQEFVALSLKNKKDLDETTISNQDIKIKEIFGVYLDTTIIGEVSLWTFSDNSESEISISYWIDKDHRNLGYASTAVNLALKHCFEALNKTKIYAHTTIENYSSKKLLSKLGFIETHFMTFNAKKEKKVFSVYELEKKD